MSCLICNELLHHMCEHCNISKPFSPPWLKLLTLVYLWTNHMCISYKHILVHLGCHLITKTKQGPFKWTMVKMMLQQAEIIVIRCIKADTWMDNGKQWLSDKDKNLGTMSHGSIQSEVWFVHLCSFDFSGSTSFRASCRHSHIAYWLIHTSSELCAQTSTCMPVSYFRH